jgi:N-acetylneuraminic acid mutarotase
LIAARTLPAFFQSDARAKFSRQTLSFAERVAYQHAIEDVYWRHRIWPKEQPGPKPSLDAVMSRAQLERKVADYLRKSQALEDYWQRPITAEQLQAEMERMAINTKKPEVLRELFAALGNDAFVIAECLARPALADRFLTNSYGKDENIHKNLKQRAQSDLQMHPTAEQMKQLTGTYRETEFVKTDSAHRRAERVAAQSVKLDGEQWEKTVQKLAATLNESAAKASGFGVRRDLAASKRSQTSPQSKNPPRPNYETIPVRKVTRLQEDATHYFATAVIEKNTDRFKLATVSWQKEAMESWLLRAENQVPAGITAPQVRYALPKISDGGTCNENTWAATAAPPEARDSHTAVWTGSEMIIWGGRSNSILGSGGKYDPATDTWTFTNTAGAPSPRANHTAVWTGTEMIVWGGDSADFPSPTNTGGKYNPTTNSWIPTSTTNAPDGRTDHSAVWTGSQMIVWGGLNDFFEDLNTGGRYNPVTDSWTATTVTNSPEARDSHTAIWSGSEMIVWGGFDNFNFVDFDTGGRYNPNTDTWTATSTNNVPEARQRHTAIWTGSEMIVWGGFNEFNFEDLNTGGRYNPNTDSWTATSTFAPDPRELHTAVWTGSEMIVWGGVNDFNERLNTGGKYNPGTNSWTGTSTTNAPDARDLHTAVWTGTEMIVWGGIGEFPGGDLNTGGRYNATTNNWTPTNTYNTPEPRTSHTAVWTGTEMVVWGGTGQDVFASTLNTGGRYDPATDNWTATNVADAPSPRDLHTAVWTGSEMIVWGGTGDFINFNDGGRYNPGADSWIAMTTVAPYPRFRHTAVWTGTQMIIWGGESDAGLLDTGGKYNPNTNTWTETTPTNAPTARDFHTAVWAGSQMIVWGGEDDNFNRMNTGGRYDPVANSWTATSTTNAPSPREFHTAVWTATEMIIWGGEDDNFEFPRAGGKYNPATNSWIATTDIAPDGRIDHSAVWTGTQMIVWGGQGDSFSDLNTGGQYNPSTDSWTTTNTNNAPSAREFHTAVWTGSETGSEMIVWGGNANGGIVNTGGRYCAQGAPTPTPTPTPTATPLVPRPTPAPRLTPTPHPRP